MIENENCPSTTLWDGSTAGLQTWFYGGFNQAQAKLSSSAEYYTIIIAPSLCSGQITGSTGCCTGWRRRRSAQSIHR
ncbi:MAG: hypothetical protein U0694_16435, partial [Anaerolineae bacterium]